MSVVNVRQVRPICLSSSPEMFASWFLHNKKRGTTKLTQGVAQPNSRQLFVFSLFWLAIPDV
jgi:hypothetical protein